MHEDMPYIGHVSTIKVEGLDLRIARSGKSNGIPIVLFSPWPESIYGFRGIIPALVQLGPVTAVDLPGFGMSQGHPSLMSPVAMADFMIKLLDSLGLTRVHAIGPDIATLSLLFAASSHPSRFESLILGSAGTKVELAGAGLHDLIFSPPEAFARLEGGDLALGFVRQSAARPIPDSVIEDYRRSSSGRRFEDATNFVRAYVTDLPILEGLLPDVSTPTLVISSTHDVMVPVANGDFLKDRLPHSRHVILDGGHLIWEDAADSYAANTVDWITGSYQTV